ncbi:MAG: immunoglobulin domain-containing protein [Opitutaceae bacterium]
MRSIWSLILWLSVSTGPGTRLAAQIDYATPYSFAFLAGSSGTAGSADGTGSAALFKDPYGLALDSSGNLYVADKANDTIRMVTAAGVVTTLAGTPGSVGTTDGTGAAAQFNQPVGLAVASGGVIYVADSSNYTIRKIASGGVVTTLAGAPGKSGYIDATGGSAEFNQPYGIAIDGSGNLYVTELGNNTVRMVTSGGVVTTLAGTAGSAGSTDGTGTAARFNQPIGIAIDGSGNLYVADSNNNTIRKIASGGVVTTLAGSPGSAGTADGTGSAARFRSPRGVATDAAGNIYVADSGNCTIRKVTPAGVVTTLAGTPGTFASVPGTGAAALFDVPVGIAVGTTGSTYVTNELAFTIEVGAQATTVAPSITQQPTSQTIASGSTVVFSVAASGLPAPAYQWYLGANPLSAGAGVSGVTGPTLVISGAAQGGTYYCQASNSAGTAMSNAATLTVSTTSDVGRLVNISTRAQVGTGGNILIAGFVVGGAGTTGSDRLLVRGSGPALAAFNVAGLLPDPQLQLYSGATVLASNSGWGGSSQIAAAAAAVGAFAWTDPTSHDSALLQTLAAGPYTAQISGASGDAGVALAEVYDTTPAASYTLASPRLVNISTRAQVGTGGDILIAGFVIGGTTSKTMLVRASGPALSAFNVTGPLPDPQLQLFGGSTMIAANDGWGGNAQIAAEAAAVGAFAWSSPTSADSAILITLPPGAYTAQVSGASGDTGVSLVEVYEVP